MNLFDYDPRTRILFGPGQLSALGQEAGALGCRRALVVSDPGVVSAGHAQQAMTSLESAGLAIRLFDGVAENPTAAHVERGVEVAREFEPDLLVGVGGGSSMDCAKGINFIYCCGGTMQDYWGVGKATSDLLPMIAVPTTAGTGSEAQSFTLISNEKSHVKMACGDKRAACRLALLDPEVTLTQPPQVTALTGIDAIAHAVETFVTNKRTPISLAFSREAWRLLSTSFPKVLDDPSDVIARGGMQLGACFAGMAIENSMLGAAHALANPLTSRYDIPHGQAVGLMLPHVVRFNGEEVDPWYIELLEAGAHGNGAPLPSAGSQGVAAMLTEMFGRAGIPLQLGQCDVPQDVLPDLAKDAAKQWTGGFNPRRVGENELLDLYVAAY